MLVIDKIKCYGRLTFAAPAIAVYWCATSQSEVTRQLNTKANWADTIAAARHNYPGQLLAITIGIKT